MKKFLVILLLCVVLFGGKAFAIEPVTAAIVYEYDISNDSGGPLTTLIPTYAIRPNVDKIVGYTVMPTEGQVNTESYVGLYDTTSSALSGEKLGELEASDNASKNDHFIRPKKILNGVGVRQGARTTVIVFFIRT